MSAGNTDLSCRLGFRTLGACLGLLLCAASAVAQEEVVLIDRDTFAPGYSKPTTLLTASVFDPVEGELIASYGYTGSTLEGRIATLDNDGAASGYNLCSSDIPAGLGIDPVRGRLFVTCSATQSLVVYDMINKSILHTEVMGSAPGELRVDVISGRVYILEPSLSRVAMVDPAAWSTTYFALGTGPYQMAMNTSIGRLYVSNNGSGTLTMVSSAGVITTRTVTSSPGPIAVNPVSGRVWVGSTTNGNLTILNSSNTVLTTLIAGVGPAKGLVCDPVVNKAWMISYTGTATALATIDGATDTVSFEDLTALGSIRGLVADPDHGRLWFQTRVSSADTIHVLNTATGVRKAFASPWDADTLFAVNPMTGVAYGWWIYYPFGSSTPSGIEIFTYRLMEQPVTRSTGSLPIAAAVNERTHRVYVANQGGNSVSVLDGISEASVASVSLGAAPAAIACNPFSNRVYTANRTASTVSVLDGAANTLAATVAVAGSPALLTIDPVVNRILVASDVNGRVTILDGVTQSVVGTVDTGVAGFKAVAVDLNMHRAWLASPDGFAVAVNLLSGNWTQVGVGATPEAILLVNNHVFVANGGSDSVTVIDRQTDAVVTTINGLATHPIALDYNPRESRVEVICRDLTGSGYYQQHRINAVSLAVAETWHIYGFSQAPYGIRADPVTGDLYVLENGPFLGAGKLHVRPYKYFSDSYPTSFSLGVASRSIAMDAGLGKIFVPNAGNNNLSSYHHHPDHAVPLTSVVTGPAGGQTTSTTPLVYVAPTSAYSPVQTTRMAVVATTLPHNGKRAIAVGDGTWYSPTTPLSPGINRVWGWAGDGQVGGSHQATRTPSLGAPMPDQVLVVPSCSAPTITQQPGPAADVCSGTPVTLTAAGTGTAPMSVGWLRNGVPVVDGLYYSGAATTSLAIAAVTPATAGSYTFKVWNACGVAVTSNAVTVTVRTEPAETASLTVTRNGSSADLSWSAASGPGVNYDVIRSGSPADFVSPIFAYCVSTNQAGTTFLDTVPSAFSADYYLIRPANECGEGVAGMSSSGSEIVARTCP